MSSLLLGAALSFVLTTPSIAAQQGKTSEELSRLSQADQSQSAADEESPQHEPTPKNKPKHQGAFVLAPLPISSPALGTGIVPVVAYIFPIRASDKASPVSVLGGAGIVTNNGSRAFVLAGELYFKENSYRITAAFASGNLNYSLYGLGAGSSEPKLPLNQTGQVFFGEFLRRTWWNVFIGPRFLWGSSLVAIRPNNIGTVALPPDLGLHTNLTAFGFRLDRDTRPNRFYPTAGGLLDFTADFFAQALGSKYSFQSYKFTFSRYASLTKNQVLAYNLFACATAGQPPFYGNCIYGTNNQLRGYVAGRYLDRYMAATQLEYRLALPKRLGLVGFGGLGEVVPGANQPLRNKNFLPAGGAGVRFLLSSNHHVNLRVDFAQGKDSHTWSVGVGEAF